MWQDNIQIFHERRQFEDIYAPQLARINRDYLAFSIPLTTPAERPVLCVIFL
jgi:hypothetical protein